MEYRWVEHRLLGRVSSYTVKDREGYLMNAVWRQWILVRLAREWLREMGFAARQLWMPRSFCPSVGWHG